MEGMTLHFYLEGYFVSAYVKGGLVAGALVLGMIFWYVKNKDTFTYQTAPPQYSILDKMKAEGVPEFSLPRLDGSTFKLSDVRGKVVLINFWATWCEPCGREFPSLIELIAALKGETVLIAVATDENIKDIENFIKAFGLPQANIEIVWDKGREIANKYGVGQIPETFLVGKDGKFMRKIVGVDKWATPDAINYFNKIVEGKDPNKLDPNDDSTPHDIPNVDTQTGSGTDVHSEPKTH